MESSPQPWKHSRSNRKCRILQTRESCWRGDPAELGVEADCHRGSYSSRNDYDNEIICKLTQTKLESCLRSLKKKTLKAFSPSDVQKEKFLSLFIITKPFVVSCHEEALSKKRFHRVLLTRHTSYKAVCCVLRNEQWNTTPVTDLVRTSWNMLTHTSVALPSVHILIKHKSWPSVIMARSEVTVIVGQPLNTANCSLIMPCSKAESRGLGQSWSL